MASDQQRIKRIEQALRDKGKLKPVPSYFTRLERGEVTELEKWETWQGFLIGMLANGELASEDKDFFEKALGEVNTRLSQMEFKDATNN